MVDENWAQLAEELQSLLNLEAPPLAITFSMEVPVGVSRYAGRGPKPAQDGRTGKVSAGCVFWMKATDRTFTTMSEDHANCSVGSVTHGFKTLDEVAHNDDVITLLDSRWVTMDIVPTIPVVKQRYNYVTYGPLKEAQMDPDVIFLRLRAIQLMILHDTIPNLRFEGKPQCHIIAIAKEQNEVAVSVGCMLSRVRTGMPSDEVTCAIPSGRLRELLKKLRDTCAADNAVAQYAATDSVRFAEKC